MSADFYVELRHLGIRLIGLLIAMPIMGFGLMKVIESFEKAWKSNSRLKKWGASCGLFLFLAIIGGWLW